MVQVSLDGGEEVHNRIRGNDLSFGRAVDALRLLQEEKIELVTAATTVTPMNFGELGKLKEILAELGGSRVEDLPGDADRQG